MQTSVPPLPTLRKTSGPTCCVQPLVAFERERRARLAQRPDRREVEGASRLEPFLAAGHRERGAEAEERRVRLRREPPLQRHVRVVRIPVDHHDRRARQQRRHECVPHHPRRRREPEQPVAGTEVPAERMVLQVLDEDAAVTVDDRLRQPGRPRREQDAQRMVERQSVELQRRRLGEQVAPRERIRKRVVRAADVRDVDDVADRRQLRTDLRHLLPPVDVPVSPDVAGRREQQRGLELAEPVDDAAHAELERTRRPDRAEARGGEERDERLRDVRHERDDAVAGPDAEPLHARARTRDLVAELAEGQLDRVARLRVRDHRDDVHVLVAADHVLRVVQSRAGEPLGSRQRARAEHALVRRVRADLEEVPDRAPEPFEVGHRPAVELVVVGEVEAALGAEPVEVPADLGPRARVRGRAPEDVADGGHRESLTRAGS